MEVLTSSCRDAMNRAFDTAPAAPALARPAATAPSSSEAAAPSFSEAATAPTMPVEDATEPAADLPTDEAPAQESEATEPVAPAADIDPLARFLHSLVGKGNPAGWGIPDATSTAAASQEGHPDGSPESEARKPWTPPPASVVPPLKLPPPGAFLEDRDPVRPASMPKLSRGPSSASSLPLSTAAATGDPGIQHPTRAAQRAAASSGSKTNAAPVRKATDVISSASSTVKSSAAACKAEVGGLSKVEPAPTSSKSDATAVFQPPPPASSSTKVAEVPLAACVTRAALAAGVARAALDVSSSAEPNQAKPQPTNSEPLKQEGATTVPAAVPAAVPIGVPAAMPASAPAGAPAAAPATVPASTKPKQQANVVTPSDYERRLEEQRARFTAAGQTKKTAAPSCAKASAMDSSTKLAAAGARPAAVEVLAVDQPPRSPDLLAVAPSVTQVQLHVSIRRLCALDVATRSFSVGLTCTTLHESHEDDHIVVPQDTRGLCLVDNDIQWSSRKFMPTLQAASAHEQVWGPWKVMVSADRGRRGRPMLLCTRSLTARLQLDVDLRDYPLDVQILSISLTLTAGSDVAQLVPLREDLPDGTPDLVHVDYAHIHLPSFAFVADCPHVAGVRTLRERLCYSNYRGQSQAYVHIPLTRSHDACYIASVAVPPFGIGLLACLVFALQEPTTQLADRMTIDVVLLLVAAMHRTYIASVLPPGRRSTRLDVFVTALFALLVFVTACHVAASAVAGASSEQLARTIDLTAAAVCTTAWLLFTAIYVYESIRSRRTHEGRLLKLMRFYQQQHGFEVDVAEGSSTAVPLGPSKAEAFLEEFVTLSEGGLSLHGSPTQARSISRVYRSEINTRSQMPSRLGHFRLFDEEEVVA